jgi:hypothetical protein
MTKKVNATNTKATILAAYNDAMSELDALQKAPKTTVEVAKETSVKEAISTASDADIEGVAGRFLDAVSTLKYDYDSIETAIAAKRDELAEILDIEAEANSLVAIVTAKDKLVADKEDLARTIITEAQERAAVTISEAGDIREETLTKLKDEKAAILLDRKREQSEYDYNTTRDRRRERDAFEDQLDEMDAKLSARIKEVEAREATADELDNKVADLNDTILVMEAGLKIQLGESFEAGKKKAEKSANFAKMLAKKEFDSEVAIRDAQIVNLNEKVAELTRQLAVANQNANTASNQAVEMAKASFASQGDVNTISKVSEIAAGSNNKK